MSDNLNKLAKGAGGFVKSFMDGVKGLNDITPDAVISVIENIEIKKSQYTTEKNIENIINNFLSTAFDGRTHRQYSIGGYIGLKVDIDIGDGEVGIEVKLAKCLNTTCIERLFGQVLYYSKRTYKKNLIVLIVGTEKEYTQILKEVENIVEEQGISFCYLKVK